MALGVDVTGGLTWSVQRSCNEQPASGHSDDTGNLSCHSPLLTAVSVWWPGRQLGDCPFDGICSDAHLLLGSFSMKPGRAWSVWGAVSKAAALGWAGRALSGHDCSSRIG